LKIFAASAARRLRLFLIGGGGSKILKIFADPAATALLFLKISAAAAAQPIGLHLYIQEQLCNLAFSNTKKHYKRKMNCILRKFRQRQYIKRVPFIRCHNRNCEAKNTSS
jgi:hypothetical protein